VNDARGVDDDAREQARRARGIQGKERAAGSMAIFVAAGRNDEGGMI
jgi:hypothetical protein